MCSSHIEEHELIGQIITKKINLFHIFVALPPGDRIQLPHVNKATKPCIGFVHWSCTSVTVPLLLYQLFFGKSHDFNLHNSTNFNQ